MDTQELKAMLAKLDADYRRDREAILRVIELSEIAELETPKSRADHLEVLRRGGAAKRAAINRGSARKRAITAAVDKAVSMFTGTFDVKRICDEIEKTGEIDAISTKRTNVSARLGALAKAGAIQVVEVGAGTRPTVYRKADSV